MQPGNRVFHTLVLHHEDGVPLQCEDRHVNPACAPDYLGIDLTRTSATNHLFEVARAWTRADYSIEAERPTTREARLLAIDAGDPCLVVVRRTFSRDAVITRARLVHPGSRYRLHGKFQPRRRPRAQR